MPRCDVLLIMIIIIMDHAHLTTEMLLPSLQLWSREEAVTAKCLL